MSKIPDTLRWHFIERYKNHAYAKELIDSIQIDSNLKPKQQYLLFSAALAQKNNRIYDQLIKNYSQFSNFDIDRMNYVKYLESKKKYSDLIKEINQINAKKRSNRIYLSRLLPRTYLKIGQRSKAFNSYLDFARKFPDHPFALSAVNYVFEKYAFSNQKKFDQVINEFSKQKSRYANFYAFYKVLNQYERGLKEKAISTIDQQLIRIKNGESRDRFTILVSKN